MKMIIDFIRKKSHNTTNKIIVIWIIIKERILYKSKMPIALGVDIVLPALF